MTERQEVAEKLREAGEDIDEASLYPAAAINEITNIIDTTHNIKCYQALYNRLADLIDPTCELDLDFGMEYIVCQSCGYELPHGTHLDETKYCPNCGARVVVSKDE